MIRPWVIPLLVSRLQVNFNTLAPQPGFTLVLGGLTPEPAGPNRYGNGRARCDSNQLMGGGVGQTGMDNRWVRRAMGMDLLRPGTRGGRQTQPADEGGNQANGVVYHGISSFMASPDRRWP